MTGCATTYQKEGFFSNGYSDHRLQKDVFVVTFRANELTLPDQVYQLALQRAAELTLKHHYKYFVILSQDSKDLHYPSLRLKIQCLHDPSPGAMDAAEILRVS